jgi:hypothetical protein
MDMTDIYRVFHPATAQYAFFSAVHGTFSKIDHILGHKVGHTINVSRKKSKTRGDGTISHAHGLAESIL